MAVLEAPALQAPLYVLVEKKMKRKNTVEVAKHLAALQALLYVFFLHAQQAPL